MLADVLFGIGMLLVTLGIQFFLFKTKRNINFWSGNDIVLIMCIFGLLTKDIGWFAGILGYVVGDYIGKFAGWHKNQQ